MTLSNLYRPDWNQLTITCQQAMEFAKRNPGRYGGRYVGRHQVDGRTEFLILADDDPSLDYGPDIDILAQVTPHAVHAIGGARFYLRVDGTVDFGD